MKRKSFLKWSRLPLILLQVSLTALCCQCAPQSIKQDSQEVELLPDPKIKLQFPPATHKLEGKSFVGPPSQASFGKVARVLSFLEDGKIASYDVAVPGETNLNATHGIGFYGVTGNRVEIADYGYDSGIPGYRYFRASFELNERGDRLLGYWELTPTKFKITRKWRPMTEGER